MRCLRNICAVLIVLCASRVSAQDAAQPITSSNAKASLALAKAARDREPSKAALSLKQCKCERTEHDGCMTDLNAATTKASSAKTPLFVWIGMTCDKEIRAAFPGAVHVHVDQLNGSSAPRLVISKGKQETWRLMKSELGPKVIQPILQWIVTPERVSQPQKTSAVPVSLSASC